MLNLIICGLWNLIYLTLVLPLEYVDFLLENDVGQIKTADNRILQEQLESKVS